MRKLQLHVAIGLAAILVASSVLVGAAQEREPGQPTGWPPTMWEIAYAWCWENIADPQTCGTEPLQWPPSMWVLAYQWCWQNVADPDTCGTHPVYWPWVFLFRWCGEHERENWQDCRTRVAHWPPSIEALAYKWCWENIADPQTCGTVPPRGNSQPQR